MTTTSRRPLAPTMCSRRSPVSSRPPTGHALSRRLPAPCRRATRTIVSETQYEAALTTREQVNAVLARAAGRSAARTGTRYGIGRVPRELRRSLDDGQAALAAADACTGRRRSYLTRSPRASGFRHLGGPAPSRRASSERDACRTHARRCRTQPVLCGPPAHHQRAQCARRNRDDERHRRRGRPTAGARGARARRHAAVMSSRRRCRKGDGAAAADSAVHGCPIDRTQRLGEALPEACLPRAKALGLEPADVPELAADLRVRSPSSSSNTRSARRLPFMIERPTV